MKKKNEEGEYLSQQEIDAIIDEIIENQPVPAVKEIKTKRQKIREQLLQFIKKIPVFMYLTDDREQTLLDVIQQLETDLFSSVTNLTLADFNHLIDLGVFRESTMNDAVFAFKRFEDASLIYLDEAAEKDQTVGGWNTKISREEFVNLT